MQSDNPSSTLVQFLGQAMRAGRAASAIAVVERFPALKNMTIVTALRTAEPEDREGVFATLGPPSVIFAKMAGLTISDIRPLQVCFDTTPGDLDSAARLLPVVCESDGPTAAFPCAIFMLERLWSDREILESLARFLDALIVEPLVREDGLLDCVGMVFSRDDHAIMRKSLNAAVDRVQICSFRAGRLDLLVCTASLFRRGIGEFFERFRFLDSEREPAQLASELRTRETGLAPDDCRRLAGWMRRERWRCWPACLLLALGDSAEAALVIREDPILASRLSAELRA